MKLQGKESEIIISVLEPAIQGSWAELYGARDKEKENLTLLLMVGEPMRRKMTPLVEKLVSEMKQQGLTEDISLLITSPEGGNKNPGSKTLYKKANCLKKW